MALGDGIRRSLATVSKEERDMLRDAILQLNQVFYSPGGSRTDFPAGHVSEWFKQDEIHQSSHVHGCPAFLPWHREMLNRFEALIRTINPQLSLHYWDWNLDPANMPDGQGGSINLFDAEFMGNADPAVNGGAAGEPLLSAGFYDPNAANYRDNLAPVTLNRPNPNDPTTWSYPDPNVPPHLHYNPADPPRSLTRGKQAGAPPVGQLGAGWATDDDLVTALTWEDFRNLMYGDEQGTSGVGVHGAVHSYIGGDLANAHLSFRDPFVFLMHANIDRLWAMWQRRPGYPDRLNPATAYGSESNSIGSGDVEFGDPSWGIKSPLEPWAGLNAQTAATGQVTNLWPIRPWFAPENEQNLPANYKTSQDPSVVFPPSYDTVPHSAWIVHQVDTFSDSQVQNQAAYPGALLLIYDGFTLNELGGNPPPAPGLAVTFDNIGGPDASAAIQVTAGTALTEGGGPDVPQRITFPLDITIADPGVFATFNDTRFVAIQATGGAVTASAVIRLTKQPNPYMLDGNPYWLSTDVRVFHLSPSGSTPGSTTVLPDPAQDPNAPLTYINQLLQEFRGQSDFNNDPAHPFEKLTTDETASWLEQSQTIMGTPVFNFAVAKVRYRANMTAATGVQVFFRTFMTMRSALDYVYTGANPPSINYTRAGAWPNAVPLLGTIDGEIASIPYFAVPRIDSVGQPMTAQPIDMPNVQTINAVSGQENVMFFGVWLDFNQPTNRFPVNPSGVGPFGGSAQPIPALINGLHQCLVAEVFFQPGGGADPIPSGANPATSDRLSQRNLSIDTSGNPGWPQTHSVAHSFMLKPSPALPDVKAAPAPQPAAAVVPARGRRRAAQAARGAAPLARAEAVVSRYRSDELLIRWNNVPRDTQATLFLPEWSADTVLQMAAARQHPQVLSKLDDHTLAITVSDVTWVPLPRIAAEGGPGLVTLTLPDTVRVGQLFRADFHQVDGLRSRVDGSFRLTVPVADEAEMLPQEVRHLAFLRYVAEKRAPSNRWTPVFARWTALLSDKVRALGGDPTAVPPSLIDPTPPPHKPEPGDDECFVGKVACLRYDCFGDFEGFVLESCAREHFIPAREPAIERIAHRACMERSILRVVFDRLRRRIHSIEARSSA
jgi:hypothetical protein